MTHLQYANVSTPATAIMEVMLARCLDVADVHLAQKKSQLGEKEKAESNELAKKLVNSLEDWIEK